MTIGLRAVAVIKLPAVLSVKDKLSFLHDAGAALATNRPRLVLDCSAIGDCDSSVIHLLLHCLEEAMKRNGDVKLACVPAHAAIVLVSTGVARLFETFDTTEEAVSSFHRLPSAAIIPPALARTELEGSAQPSEEAA